MHPKRVPLLLFACLLVSSLSSATAGITVQLVSTFRYPAQDSALITAQMNDANVLVGYISTAGDLQGFYGRVGSGPTAFREPDDTGGITMASGINHHQVICGNYADYDTTKGFNKTGNSYTSFVAPGDVLTTFISSINDAGNFVGFYSGFPSGAFSVIDGIFSTLPVPGIIPTATGINNLNQIVGEYTTADDGVIHGYLLDTDHSLITNDYPGALRTEPAAINDAGLIVGSWYDGAANHGFLLQQPSTFTSYDVPESASTMITGINNRGYICGTYFSGTARKPRGFIALIQSDQ